MENNNWTLVKRRTADADGAVYVSADGRRYRRTGGEALRAELAFQQMVEKLGYPVPRLLAHGQDADGRVWVVEESLGARSLHDEAVADGGRDLSDTVVDQLAQVSARLLHAQVTHPVAAEPGALQRWVDQAGWTHNVFAENPDLDTARTRGALALAVERLDGLPLVWSHLDYGLPNALRAGVIDWQHHGVGPAGYDVTLALEIIPFKGGAKGYTASPAQRGRYLAALDSAAEAVGVGPVSKHLGDFLLVKSLFFLALMRPADPDAVNKHQKWQYRRHLVEKGIEQYERTGDIDTTSFPTLDEFAAG
ncbi:aminoglycoside phosphotransferase family protein [Streptomyces sp. NPDC001584]|uniref:aminoglycoside phosphotransferase family protein n=1 Tax=Streptomyces sp. NPDC001584 TaxID=3154521 RepID=UPI0033225501